MSIAQALAFIRQARSNEALRDCIADVSNMADASELAACADGFAFTDDELDAAFRMDWTARWLHYSRSARDE